MQGQQIAFTLIIAIAGSILVQVLMIARDLRRRHEEISRRLAAIEETLGAAAPGGKPV